MQLKDRGKALEDQFFQREEARKLAALKDQLAKSEIKKELRASSGMTDDQVLDRLVEIGITAKTIAAVSLVPLIEVAWADNKMDEPERNAILQGAKGKGIEQESPAYKLLSHWLERRPGPELLEAWIKYIEALEQELTKEQLQILKRQIVDRARSVAEVAGGFLYGTFGRVSSEEKSVIAKLENVFDSYTRATRA